MATFKIQTYNREMTELLAEEDKDFERTEKALSDAYWKGSANVVIVLMRKSNNDSRCWKLIAKFY